MRRFWVIGLMTLAALGGVVGAKLHSRVKLAEYSKAQDCFDVPCAHRYARLLVIKSVIAQRSEGPVYLALGDSIMEMAELEPLCGRRPINAGIAWATADTFLNEAKPLVELARPDFAVLAVGTNDVFRLARTDFVARLDRLVQSLAPLPIIVVPIPPGRAVGDMARYNSELRKHEYVAPSLDAVETLEDGVHLTANGYVQWKATLRSGSRNLCDRLRPSASAG